jgi:hypothetical protein
MTIDSALGINRPPLTQARVQIHLRDGRTLVKAADGARGYPDHPASDAELDDKFLSCAIRSIAGSDAEPLLQHLRRFDALSDVRVLTSACRSSE